MTKSFSTLPYEQTTAQGDYIAPITIDTSQDTDWVFTLTNSYFGEGERIVPKYVVVDNIGNNGVVFLSYGAFTLQVVPYTRKTFALPDQVQQAEIKASVGTVFAYFCQNTPGIPDDVNQLAINQAVAPKAVFTPITITASRAQQVGDLNGVIQFTSAIPITYQLQLAASVVNGFYNPKLWNNGSSTVTIAPSGADTINGIYAAGNPLILNPGDYVDLITDNTTWFAHGTLTFSVEFPLTQNNGATYTHNFQKRPDHIGWQYKCITADGGYAAGDLVDKGQNDADNNGAFPAVSVWHTITQGTWRIAGWNAFPSFANKGSTAQFTVVPGNWHIVINLRAFI